MAFIQIWLVMAFAICRVPAPHQTTMCTICNGQTDPSSCTGVQKCHPDEMCYTDVYSHNGQYQFYKGCKKAHDCPYAYSHAVGKRAHHNTVRSQVVCGTCCDTNVCNLNGCDQYASTTAAATTATTATTTHSITTAQKGASSTKSGVLAGGCQDHEEDGFNCTTYDTFNICQEKDNTTLRYVLAHTKCPKYCGFCTNTLVGNTATGSQGVASSTSPTSTIKTTSRSSVSTHRSSPLHTTATLPMTSSIQPSLAVTTPTGKLCVDHEDVNFSCATWGANGHCDKRTVALGSSAPSHTKMCFQCHGLDDPSACTQVHKCHPDESCFTDVIYANGGYHVYKGCKKARDCPSLIVVGKRTPVDKNHQLVCEDCCGSNGCNIQGCDQYFQTTTMSVSTPAPSLAAVSQPVTQAPGSSCLDHEEDGFSCTMYDRYNFCTVTDPASLSYSIAHNKCPKHCGFCSTTTAVQMATTVQGGQCRDHEEDGFKCADYDQYNFCTDISSIAYLFAHQKCPKHCGFCQTQNGGMSTHVSLTSTHPTTAAPGFSPQVANVVVSQMQTSTGKPCADFEDSTFSCASWASNGFCQSPTGVLHEITVMRCSKYCGIC